MTLRYDSATVKVEVSYAACSTAVVGQPEKMDEELRIKVPPSWKRHLESQQTPTKNVSDLVREALERRFPSINDQSRNEAE